MYIATGYRYSKNPTIKNTDKWYYNCGGYALHNFRWYIPAEDNEAFQELKYLLKRHQYLQAALEGAAQVCKDFGYTCIATDLIKQRKVDYKRNEIVAFRYEQAGLESDFHFMKIGKNGNWYEKRGCDEEIYRHEYNYVFDTWGGRYDGPIVFMIKERS